MINSATGGELIAGTAENDRFVFNAITDSQPGAGNFDTITNFMHNSDHIDLTAIDGATTVQGLVDYDKYSRCPQHQLVRRHANNQTIVYVNTTDTANHVDMEIHLAGTNINLSGSDILHHT